MQNTQHQSILSSVRKIFMNETSSKKPAAEMRRLTEDELRAVAGGPECDVGSDA